MEPSRLLSLEKKPKLPETRRRRTRTLHKRTEKSTLNSLRWDSVFQCPFEYLMSEAGDRIRISFQRDEIGIRSCFSRGFKREAISFCGVQGQSPCHLSASMTESGSLLIKSANTPRTHRPFVPQPAACSVWPSQPVQTKSSPVTPARFSPLITPPPVLLTVD